MPVHSIVEAADCPAAEQLLLTIGRAGVLSSRAIAAGELETLLRLLGPPSERQRSDLKRATDIVLVENGAVIYWPRTGELVPPRRRRLCDGARASDSRMSTAALKRELALLRSSLAALNTGAVRHARRSHRLGRAHRRADARSLAARCAALRRAATAPQCDATERQEHRGRAQGGLDGASWPVSVADVKLTFVNSRQLAGQTAVLRLFRPLT